MLLAVHVMYNDIKNIIISTVMMTTIGVRLGTPISCLPFVTYINKIISMMKGTLPNDDSLGNMRVLLLIDETVLMTSSQRCVRH